MILFQKDSNNDNGAKSLCFGGTDYVPGTARSPFYVTKHWMLSETSTVLPRFTDEDLRLMEKAKDPDEMFT